MLERLMCRLVGHRYVTSFVCADCGTPRFASVSRAGVSLARLAEACRSASEALSEFGAAWARRC